MKDEPYSLGDVADRLAIQDMLSRYVHAVDARQYDVLNDVFLPDCEIDLSQAGGPVTTWREVEPYFAANQIEAFPHYLHTLLNVLITLNPDRTEAHSVSKVINPGGRMGDDGQMHHFEMLGHHHDDWRKVGDGWRIARRRWENLWISGDYPFACLPGDFARSGEIGAQTEEVAMYVHGAFAGQVRVAPEIHSIPFHGAS